MNILSIIGTGVALANYRKAKAAYEALEEKQATIQAAVTTYNENKYALLDAYEENEADAFRYEENERPDGLNTGVVLRVANLVGKLFKARGSVVMTNTSHKAIHIKEIEAVWFVLDVPLNIFEKLTSTNASDQHIYPDQWIAPGQTIEFQLPGGVSSLGEYQGELRDAICEAAGKKLITSCPKINVEGIAKTNYKVQWTYDTKDDKTVHQFYTNGKDTVLRYCGEAGL